MPERTEGSIEIDASPPEIMEVITDFESYPEWAEGIKAARIGSRDDRGRPAEVSFEFSAMGFDAAYTLAYEYAPDHGGVSWTTREASGAVKDVEGEYVLEAENGDTTVTYRLAVEVGVPLPGFLKRRADKQAIKTALEGLKKRVEAYEAKVGIRRTMAGGTQRQRTPWIMRNKCENCGRRLKPTPGAWSPMNRFPVCRACGHRQSWQSD